MFELSLPQTKEAIIRCMEAGLVPLVSSQPGVGKSAIVREIAETNNLELIDIRLAQCEPTDLLGLPKIGETKAIYLPMSIFPLEGDPLPKGKDGWILFCDELRNADTQVQNACYKLVLDRMIGEHKLHEKCYIVCASNRESDNSYVVPMPSALKSRLIHINTQLNSKAWIDYAINKGIDSRIVAFLMHRPDLLASDHTNSSEESYACPRTWEFLSQLLEKYDFEKMDNEERFVMKALIGGTIGSGVAAEFLAYTEYFDKLPKYEEIISGKAKKINKDNVGLVWALIGIIGTKVQESHLEKIFTYMIPHPEELTHKDNISGDFFNILYQMLLKKFQLNTNNKIMKWTIPFIEQYLEFEQ